MTFPGNLAEAEAHPRAAATEDYIVCGWRVRSSWPLPEALAWRHGDHEVDITITHGKLPAQIGERAAAVPYVELGPDGHVLIHATPRTRFLVSAESVVVDTRLPPESTEWRAYLLGPVLAAICYLRGMLALHASAVRMGGGAIAIAGRSGAGKSTLAVALALRGHAAITDDVCVCVDLAERPLAIPTYPAFRLGSESLQALGLHEDGLVPIGLDLEKRQLPRPEGFDPKPVPLEAVYLIEEAPLSPETDDVLIPVSGAEAFERLSTELYRPPLGGLLMTKEALFTSAAQLAARVEVRRLVRLPGFTRLEGLAEMIEADALRLSH